MGDRRFVPDDFVPPPGLTGPGFRMVPLGPEHNESDYAAWSSSSAHIHATPGFEAHPWPVAMTRAENLGDLEQHARDHAERSGFTYTVLAPDRDEVIGCVYIYPARDSPTTTPTSAPGSARKTPSSTHRCTRRSAPGWRSGGRSSASTTPRAPWHSHGHNR